LGKKAAFPLGLLLGLTAWEIGLVVILSDFVLMAVIDRLLVLSIQTFSWGHYLTDRTQRIQERLGRRKWTASLMKLGWLGPLVITTVPFGGGVWTGTALARIMHLSKKQTILSVGVGVILGCLIFVLAALGILSMVEISAPPNPS